MALKRSAPPPPPPPPPVASSEETASGSDSDESEEEEVPAALPAPVVSNKGEESESEGEEESEEEGEDMVRSSATQKRAPPPQNREEDESSGDEEEEGESSDSDKPPPPPPLNLAPKQGAVAEGNGSKISSPKKQAFQRTWSTEDEVRILEALAAHRREHGALPQIDALVSTLAGSLDHPGVDTKGLRGKVRTLKRRYDAATKKKSGELPSNDHDRRIFDLSKSIWGSSDNATAATGTAAGREFGEMCELYPHLAEEVKALEAAHPGLFKRDFGRLDDDKARALDMKVKKQRIAEITVELRRGDLTKEVTKVLAELVQ